MFEYVQDYSDRELMDELYYCGCDAYYAELYRAVTAELERRLGLKERKET